MRRPKPNTEKWTNNKKKVQKGMTARYSAASLLRDGSKQVQEAAGIMLTLAQMAAPGSAGHGRRIKAVAQLHKLATSLRNRATEIESGVI